MASIMEILFGRPERTEQVSPFNQQQNQLFNQLMQALGGSGAGGAFGSTADFYRDLLSGDSETAQMMEAPLQRQFQQETIPGLAAQFGGMGSGALSSSGFRNAGVQAGTDLSERLGAIRAGLRQQGAQGLTSLGQQGLQPIQESIIRPREQGLVGGLAQGLAPGLGFGFGFGRAGGS